MLVLSWMLLDILIHCLFCYLHGKFIFSWTYLEPSLVEVSISFINDRKPWTHTGVMSCDIFRNGISPFCREGAQEWAKDRKSRPMQQEDEYRLQMELNRCLKKDTAVLGADPDLYESQTTRTVSSRGWNQT